jgi:uncharacterized ion transporter superfamily protein YfcC
MYYARRTRRDPAVATEGLAFAVSWRDLAILFSILAAFVVYIYGAQRLGWEFNELAAVFFVVGVLAGAIGRLGTNGTAEGFVEGFRAMAFASLVIGFARAIYVVLSEGRIIDTLVRGLSAPLADLPTTLSAFGMLAAQTAIHVPVPSTSGQAVLTLPLLVPLSDLIGLSRQVTVLAYQYGAGLCDLITPTNGALMAMLAAAGVRYDDWLKLAGPLYLLLIGLSLLALTVAVSLGLS